ncbi:MAG: HAD-IA family hydrolase [Clostridia bacterium]|nr:HAD-IA family hydrolase [Clostridia bacterium]
MIFTSFFWDFDGTLYNTYPGMARALQKALLEYGIEAPTDEIHRRMKITLRDACVRYCLEHPRSGATPEALEARFAVYNEQESLAMRPYPGAREMLRAVISGGGRNYLFTHRAKTLLPALEREVIADLFSDMVTASDHFARKPSPDALLYLIQKHGLHRADCCMVGDREIDLGSAKGARISRVLFDPEGYMDPNMDVPWRFVSMDDMRKALCGKGD